MIPIPLMIPAPNPISNDLMGGRLVIPPVVTPHKTVVGRVPVASMIDIQAGGNFEYREMIGWNV
ncbi:hypothetical protein KJ903_01560 [Patescibacteria group bacterium]|nr:hypothetical protein [Patescibacteria group bacterium]